LKFNLHTHTRYSDGSDEPEKYVEEAIRQGFHTLGFSDHSPVPFENNFAIREGMLSEYCKAIQDLVNHPPPLLQERGVGGEVLHSESGYEVNILLGLEVDYIPGLTQSFEFYRKNYPFDYLIGSIHLIRKSSSDNLWFIDGPDIEIYERGLKEIFGGDITKAVTAYFHQLNEMIITEKPDIIGHLDKIKMYNRGRYFSEDDEWYISLVDESLQLIRETGCVIEVNTRGMYKKRSEALFPGPEILKKILPLKIPVTITSDAHKPFELSLLFGETKKFLKEIGFKNQRLLTLNGWTDIRI